jgi:hypothetical protein
MILDKKAPKRPNLGSKKGNLGEKIAKNSENWPKQIALESSKTASVYRVKTVFWGHSR